MRKETIQRIAEDALGLAAEIMRQSPQTPFTSVDAWVSGAMPGFVAVEAAREAMGADAARTEARVSVHHTGMKAHDGYVPHSHEVRPDHKGVRRA